MTLVLVLRALSRAQGAMKASSHLPVCPGRIENERMITMHDTLNYFVRPSKQASHLCTTIVRMIFWCGGFISLSVICIPAQSRST